jgi:hypothetical protein
MSGAPEATPPRYESVPMVSGSAREHHRAHERQQIARTAPGRSNRSARRPPYGSGRLGGWRPDRRARHPQDRGNAWRRRVRSGPRRQAPRPGSHVIRTRRPAVCSAGSWIRPRLCFARACSWGDDRSTASWPTERALCKVPRWRCAHGSSSPTGAGGNWRPVSSGSSRTQSEWLRRARLPYRFRDAKSSERKRVCSVSQRLCATTDRCMREGWRCCRACSAMAGVPHTTRVPETPCARRSE